MERPSVQCSSWWKLRSPTLQVWKSRLPIIVLPVLAGLRKLSWRERSNQIPNLETSSASEFALLFVIACGTGYLGLPFSVTWWFILLAAFTLQTELLLGVATIVSFSVLVGWYGVRLHHPHAVTALWGGTRNKGEREASIPRVCWHLWDFFVHALPATVVLYWHGPRVYLDGTIEPGTATVTASLTALPLNLLWLWGLGLALEPVNEEPWPWNLRLWPRHMLLKETNRVYGIAPELPLRAWQWAYGSHWGACTLLLCCHLLPSGAKLAYLVFAAFGLCRMPFTTAWWFTFLLSVFIDGLSPLFLGIVCCCAATTAIGWYGLQLFLPYVFQSLLSVWVFRPAERWAPKSISLLLHRFRNSCGLMLLMRFGDLLLHLVPTLTATWWLRSNLSFKVALAALPCNLIYLAFSRCTSLAQTNQMYGIHPEPPNYIWYCIYGSHWAFCIAVGAMCCFADVTG